MTSNDRPDFPRYQTAGAIRDETFQRRMRGLDADEVYEYLDLLADQVEAAEGALRESRAENERLRAEVQRVRAELEDYEQVGERVNDQVVQLFSQAQLIAEEMVQDVSRDARERIGQARASERKIVAGAMDTAGQQVRSYARAAQAQMQSIMESFADQVDRLGDAQLPAGSSPSADHRVDPLFDDVSQWDAPFSHGSGRETPGSY